MLVINHKIDVMIQGIATYTFKNTDLNYNNSITNPKLYPEMQILGSYKGLLYDHLNVLKKMYYININQKTTR